MDDVIIVFRGKVVRVPAYAYDMVMSAACQMRDDWHEYYQGAIGHTRKRADAGLAALNDMELITFIRKEPNHEPD